jgi:hypothetical protein
VRKLIAIACLAAAASTAVALSTCLMNCCAMHHVASCMHKSQHAPVTAAKQTMSIAKFVPAPSAAHMAIVDATRTPRATPSMRALRNVISFGALRVDDDIGLHTLFVVFLI